MKKVKLGEVCEILSGYAFKSSQFNDKKIGLPLIRIRDVERGFSDTYFEGAYPEEYLIKNGDLLITMDGSFILKKWEGDLALLNQRVCKIKITDKSVDEGYIAWMIPKFLKEIEDKTPFVTVKHLSVAKIKDISFVLPNKLEQKLISKKLNTISQIYDFHKIQSEELNELVKSRFNEMFGDPVLNEMGWEIETLNKIGTIGRGVSKHRPRNASELFGGIYPFIQTGDVANSGNYIVDYHSTYSEFGLKQSKLWDRGTLCITIAANIAKTSILAFDSCFPDSIVGFIPGERTNNMFIHYWFSYFQKILESQAPESAQKNINLKILSELKVILPPLSLQNEFAYFVAQVDKSQFACQKAIKLWRNSLKSSII